MSTSLIVCDRAHSAAGLWGRLWDYHELARPRIAAMELLTVAAAAFVANWGPPGLGVLVPTLLGTVLVAASASACNQWLERASDLRMSRTAARPLPAGRMGTLEVGILWASTLAAGVAILLVTVGVTTAVIGLATWVLYVCVYTPLKSRTPLNTVVGAVAGALPVLMGWTAVGAPIGIEAATLFSMVFLWQFPHFMAIAWLYRHDYAAAGMRMWPVVDPSGMRAGVQAVSAAAAVLLISLLPALVGAAGPAYVGWSVALGSVQLAVAVRFLRRLDEPSARVLLRTSLVYLPAMLGLLVLIPLI